MIGAIRDFLSENTLGCVNPSLVYEEKGKCVRLSPRKSDAAIAVQVDGCLIRDTKRCDVLFALQHNQSKKRLFLVELKGTHYQDALEQLITTHQHPVCTSLYSKAGIPNRDIRGVVVHGPKAKTNRPDKEAWENANRLRLLVVPQQEGKCLDLIEYV